MAGNEEIEPQAEQTKNPEAGEPENGEQASATVADPRPEKGNVNLLAGKRLVSFRTAEQYLGISERQRQNLMSSGALETEGRGINRKITTESLLQYLPPENPK